MRTCIKCGKRGVMPDMVRIAWKGYKEGYACVRCWAVRRMYGGTPYALGIKRGGAFPRHHPHSRSYNPFTGILLVS